MRPVSMKPMKLYTATEKWRLREPFRIAGNTAVEVSVLVVNLESGGVVGRGEATGVRYRGESASSMKEHVEGLRSLIETGISHESLRRIMPASGARNAVDCALWDLESKLMGEPAWRIAGLEKPKPLRNLFTCSADEPERMAAVAAGYRVARAIKLKLTGERIDADRVRAVRNARRDVWLSVDANGSFTRETLDSIMPVLVETHVALIEQPFAVGKENLLDGLELPIPIAADESVQTLSDLEALPDGVSTVNIKLDKCGGLTESLAMVTAARSMGLETWIGCMLGTSLAMAPAFLAGQQCQFVELDAPLFLESDRPLAVQYDDGFVTCPESLWGCAS
jgi:L-alanine-DL-glutamate epimerase-like enolase superfamily enzyme